MRPSDERPWQRPGSGVSRRRAIALIGAAAGMPLLSGPIGAAVGARMPSFEWRGRALGAEAKLILSHPDEAAARQAAALCVAEVARLEQVFSLFAANSELSRLNRDGRLATPSLDMRLLLAEALRIGALSGGAFDVTVQPVWRLYARHFREAGAAPAGPSERQTAAARSLVDYRRLDLDDGRVRLAQPGMAVTLNGIAQGYITDRAADLLRDAGFDRVLVQLGETRALGGPDGGEAWRVAVPNPESAENPPIVFELADRAVATSSGLATRFEPSGRHHHLFDPATGRSASGAIGVSVIAARATQADALSTALAVAPRAEAHRILASAGGAEALFVLPDGSIRHVP